MDYDVTRVRDFHGARYILLPKHIADRLLWRKNDCIALRVAGEKIILERVPIENLAKMRFATAEETT